MNPHKPDRGIIAMTCDALAQGAIISYPTESFYGLGASAYDESAVEKIFMIKGREEGKPLPVIIPDLKTLSELTADIPGIARVLIEKFWPGGLTLLLKATPDISPLLTAGTGKIGVRISSHPIAAALTLAVGSPITGTSANISGLPGCVTAEEVYTSLGNGVDLILDGGRTAGGKGSTILDVTVNPPEIIREGMIDRKELEDVILL